MTRDYAYDMWTRYLEGIRKDVDGRILENPAIHFAKAVKKESMTASLILFMRSHILSSGACGRGYKIGIRTESTLRTYRLLK